MHERKEGGGGSHYRLLKNAVSTYHVQECISKCSHFIAECPGIIYIFQLRIKRTTNHHTQYDSPIDIIS
jgi:hypothetical protein